MDNILNYRENNSIDFIKINYSMISIFNDAIFDIFGQDEQEIKILDISNTTVLQNVTEVEFESAEKFKEKFDKYSVDPALLNNKRRQHFTAQH